MAFYSITALYSGSKGNSVLIESERARILIDAGKSGRALCNALSDIGENRSNLLRQCFSADRSRASSESLR